MKRFAASLHRLHSHPLVHGAMGLLLFLSGAWETWATLEEDIGGLRSHHGLTVYGLYILLKALSDVFEGMERMEGPE